MKLIFWILLLLVILVYSSKPTITLKPFSVEFQSPYTPFAIFFLIVSLVLFQVQSFNNGKEFAVKKIVKELNKKNGTKLTITDNE